MTKFRLQLVCLTLLIRLGLGQVKAALSSCGDNPCKNNAVCSDEPNTLYGYKCYCQTPEFTGVNCEVFTATIKNSRSLQNSVLCNNNGYLQDGQCRCQLGFTGERCQIPGETFHNPFRHINSGCLNNGYQPKEGLPCKCPEGFYGFMCEYMTSDNLSACVRVPCRNGGICTPTSYGSYACICRNGFYGQNCENILYRRTYGGFGSLLPFLMFFSLITMCVYCCCFKKNRTFQANNLFGQRAETATEVPFHASNLHSHHQAQQNNNHIIYVQPNQYQTEAPKNNTDQPPSYEEVFKKPQANTVMNNPNTNL